MKKANSNLEAAQIILSDWGYERCEISLIKERENAVFKIITPCKIMYALRIHRANYHNDKQLLSELQWMQALQEAEINVPQVIPTLDKHYFTHVEVMGEIRQVDLFEWIDGKQLGTIETGLGKDLDHIHFVFTKIGEIAGKLHNQSSLWQQPNEFERQAWDVDGLLGDSPNWGCFWDLGSLTEAQKNLLTKVKNRACDELIEFGYDAQRFSMIHADFSPENFLQDGDSIRLIDFDDAGMGWHLFEIVTALYFFQSDPNYSIAKEALIAGYRTNRELSEQDLNKLPLFMALRGITYLGWLHTRQTEPAAQAMAPALISECMSTVKRYIHSSSIA